MTYEKTALAAQKTIQEALDEYLEKHPEETPQLPDIIPDYIEGAWQLYKNEYKIDNRKTEELKQEISRLFNMTFRDEYLPDNIRRQYLDLYFEKVDELEKHNVSREKFIAFLLKIEDDMLKDENKEWQKKLLNNPKLLISEYKNYVTDNVYIGFDIMDIKTGKHKKKLYTAAKRGNFVYAENMKRKLRDFQENLPVLIFYEKKSRKPKYTPLLKFTLTYRRNTSLYDSWEKISEDLNLFVAKLRKRYGKVLMLRSYEAHADGYPHLNVDVLMPGLKFRVVYMKYKKGPDSHGRRGAWRVPGVDREFIKSAWPHGFVDVMGVSSVEGFFDYLPDDNKGPGASDPEALSLMHDVKYMTKDYRKEVPVNTKTDDIDMRSIPKGLLQTAILWAMRKRAFSFSRSKDGRNLFVEALYGIKVSMDKRLDLTDMPISNHEYLKDRQNPALIFEFVGIYHEFDTLIREIKPPPDAFSVEVPENLAKKYM